MRNKNIYSAAFLYFFLFSSHEWSVFVLFSFWEEVFEENIRNSNRRSNLQNIRFFSTAFFTTPPCGWLQIFPRLITRSAVYYKVHGWLQIKTPEFIWRRQVWFQQPCDYKMKERETLHSVCVDIKNITKYKKRLNRKTMQHRFQYIFFYVWFFFSLFHFDLVLI